MEIRVNYATDLHCNLIKPKEYNRITTETMVYTGATPLFEKKSLDESRKEHYSLLNNEKLNCLWRQKIDRFAMNQDVKIKRQLPDFIRDQHFHNYYSKYMPLLSLRNRPPAQFHLSPGPGVDKYGDKPIPMDMTMKRYKHDNKSDKSVVQKKRHRTRL